MPVRLEPFYLANVLLYMWDVKDFQAFPLISKNCQIAMLTLRVNPRSLSYLPHKILDFFPNINTMVVYEFWSTEQIEALPDTVTSIVVEQAELDNLPDSGHRFAGRVVEIQECVSISDLGDFSVFPRLERLTFEGNPSPFSVEKCHLKRLTIHLSRLDGPISLESFPFGCSEQIVFIFSSRDAFFRAKETPLPAHVRLYCSEIGKGVAPEDFYKWVTVYDNDSVITLSDGFGPDELRAFDEVLPLPHRVVTMRFKMACAECDLSFLTGLKGLLVEGLNDCSLTLPTNVVSLSLRDTQRVSVFGSDNLTSLRAANESVTITPFPRLQKFTLEGGRCSAQAFPLGDITSLSRIDITADAVGPDLRFPSGVTSLKLKVRDPVPNLDHLRELTRLQEVTIDVKTETPLDISPLTSLSRLNVNKTRVVGLPTSLVSCTCLLDRDVGLSTLTQLSSLNVTLEVPVSLTFPTQLKHLTKYGSGDFGETNISEVALDMFWCRGQSVITAEFLEKLPKTLRIIQGTFEPATLKERLPEMFPRFVAHDYDF